MTLFTFLSWQHCLDVSYQTLFPLVLAHGMWGERKLKRKKGNGEDDDGTNDA